VPSIETEARPAVLIHLDMDAFYASVEQRDQPSLLGRPVIVGGHPSRGAVLAASYEVRPFGVRSAMPMSRAIRLAPHAKVVPPRFSAYAEASEHVFSILASVTPLIEPLSLDEAFLDVTGSLSLFGPAAKIAAHLRRRIRDEVRLPASAGIAPGKMVAKIASDLAKPDGQREVPQDGVGPKSEAQLHRVGLRTVGDIAAQSEEALAKKLGTWGKDLWRLAQGEDERRVVPDREAKSIGSEDTFEEDLDDPEAIRVHLHSQATRVARRLRSAGVKTRVVQLKLKRSDFAVSTRRLTLAEPTDDGQALYRAAVSLFERTPVDGKLRLTGVSAQQLDEGGGQLGLFQEKTRTDRLNAALDKINQKFGGKAVTTADLATWRDDWNRE
jgi:DNA polymerase-4